MPDKIKVLTIVGPTAVGKTELAIEVAKTLDGEIITADSMQIYQGLDIGTAKPTPQERDGISHHLIDVVTPDQEFNVADYVRLAEQVIKEISDRGKVPIISGGTGLYIHALIDGFLFPEQGADPKIRRRLLLEAEEDNQALYEKLKVVDPDAAAKLHVNDIRRIVRALEVYYSTGKPISQLQRKAQDKEAKYNAIMFGLTRDRSELYQRINQRVDIMITDGLIEEVKKLLDKYPHQPTALQALGYKELAEYLNGECSLEEAIYVLKRDTRRYAKRQLSWFRRDKRIKWLDLSEIEKEKAIEIIINSYR